MDGLAPDLLSRIQKIKTLAERAGTPEEAQAASAQLTKLLLKHNLELSDIVTENERGIITDRRKVKIRDQWRKDLMFYVTQHNLVRVVFWAGIQEAAFVGRPANVGVAIDIFNWLMSEAEKQGAEALKSAKIKPTLPTEPESDSLSAYMRYQNQVGNYDREYTSYRLAASKPKTWVWHWRYGFVQGIAAALANARREAMGEAGEQWGLVVAHEADLDEYVKAELKPRNHKDAKVDLKVSAAKGFQAGRNMNMQAQIKPGSPGESTHLALPG